MKTRSADKLVYRLRQWLLPLLMSLALVLSVSLSPTAMAHEHHLNQNAAVGVAMPGHDMPAKKAGADHKLHPHCNPGAGCLAFTPVEPPAEMFLPLVRPAEMRPLPVLTSTSTVPPLPPPISIIVA